MHPTLGFHNIRIEENLYETKVNHGKEISSWIIRSLIMWVTLFDCIEFTFGQFIICVMESNLPKFSGGVENSHLFLHHGLTLFFSLAH